MEIFEKLRNINQEILAKQEAIEQFKKRKNCKKIEKMISKFDADIQLINQKTHNMQKAIEKYEGINKKILSLRYLNSKTWEDIAEETNYSLSQIKRIWKKISQKLE